MTDDTMAFLSLIQKSDDGDFLKSVPEAALQRIMDYDVENLIGAAPHERTPDRQTYGYHLVRVQARTPGEPLGFEAARPALEQDWSKARGEAARKQQDEALRSRYSVSIDQAALERLVKANPQ
ncbi:hypothetical protein ACO2Q0_21425 [Phenylobacterium sp. VNQ135]|uniref:hypothetical protein n=1 Tax=Phenylobacterium sp. VNQ135 TaxID=3400922 RepID=UPI003BFD283D